MVIMHCYIHTNKQEQTQKKEKKEKVKYRKESAQLLPLGEEH